LVWLFFEVSIVWVCTLYTHYSLAYREIEIDAFNIFPAAQ